MWSIFKDLSLAGRIGLVGGCVGAAVGLAAAIVVNPVPAAIMGAIFIAVVAFSIWFFFHSEVRRRRLLTAGRSGWATITAVEETGMTINENYPIAKLHLMVEPPDGEPYEATVQHFMNRFQIPAYQPGTRVQVMIDARDRDKVAVV